MQDEHCLNPLRASRSTTSIIVHSEAIKVGNTKRTYEEDAARAVTDFWKETWELDLES